MGHARFVGRVGALAVALGVGAAAATTPALAIADTADAADTAAKTDTGDTAATTSVTPGAPNASGGPPADDAADDAAADDAAGDDAADDATGDAAVDNPADDDVAGDDAADDATEDAEAADDLLDGDGAPPVSDAPTPVAGETTDDTDAPISANQNDGAGPDAPRQRSAAIDTAAADTPATSAASGTTAASESTATARTANVEDVPTSVAPIVTPVTTRPVALAPPTPGAVLAGLPGAFISAATGFVALAVAPFAVLPGLFGVPGAPPPATGVWMVLAFARRQFVNSRPTLAPTPASTDPTTGLVTGNLGGFDDDGDEITFDVLQNPARGTLTLDESTGAYTYTPAAGFAGTDTFVVAVTDSGPDGLFGFLAPARGHTSVRAITITVPQVDLEPSFTVDTVDARTGAVTGRLTGTGIGRPGVTAAVTATPIRGAVTVNSDGTFVYTPTPVARAAAAYDGTPQSDSFTVTLSDGIGPPVAVAVQVPVNVSNNALVYRVPITAGEANFGSSTFYRFENAFAFDSRTGRIYGAEIFIDRDNAEAGGIPTYATIISAGPDGTLLLSERFRVQQTFPVRVNPVTGTAYLMTVITDSDGVSYTDVTRLTADGRTIKNGFVGTPLRQLTVDPGTGRVYLVRAGVTEAGFDATNLDVFDRDGVLVDSRTIPGALVGDVVLNPVTGQAILTTDDFVARTTALTVVAADGTITTHIVDGRPERALVLNPVTGTAYQLSLIRQGTSRTIVLNGIDAQGSVSELMRYDGVELGGVAVDTASGVAYVPVGAIPAPGSPSPITVLKVGVDGTVSSVFEGTGRVEGDIVVNPRTGKAHLVVGARDFSGSSVVTIGGAQTQVAALPFGVTGSIVANPYGDSVFVTSTVGDVTTLSIVDETGAVRTATGRLIGAPVVDPADGTTYVTTSVTTEGEPSQPRSAGLVVYNGDGSFSNSYDLGGAPTGAAVINPVTGVVYQETVAFDADSASVATLVMVDRDGAVMRLTLRNASGYFFDNGDVGRFRVVPNPVTGQAYLVIASGSLGEPAFSLAIVSADGSDVTYLVLNDAGLLGAPIGSVAVNPRTGAAYLTDYDFSEGIAVRVRTIYEDGTTVTSDALSGQTAPGGLFINPQTGTVYQGTSDGAWIVDVDPALFGVSAAG